MQTRQIVVRINVVKCQLFVRKNVHLQYLFVQINVTMERDIQKRLIAWKQKKNRKPLILNGARQVGKTYTLQQFGKSQYEKIAYVNCDKNEMVQRIFAKDYNIDRIVLALSALLHIKIEPQNTLIIFDEVQGSPVVLNSLKYFCEDAPEYHVAAVGSLLGISMHDSASFPVGKVNMIRMYPMTFSEFLRAVGEAALADTLQSKDFTLINALSLRLTDLLRQYYFVGGMPAAVKEFVESRDLLEVRNLQKQILFNYRRDFSKYAPSQDVPHINLVWDSIPQLTKEKMVFASNEFKDISKFGIIIQWFINAGIVYRVNDVTNPCIPLKLYENKSFKLFMLDVGLLGAMTDIPAESILVDDTMLKDYKMVLTKQFVFTQLIAEELPIYFFRSNTLRAEIYFLVQHGTTIIPIEVKTEANTNSDVLRKITYKYPELKGLCLSMLPYQDQEWMENRPLYAAGAWL